MIARTPVGQTIVLCGLPSCPDPGTRPSPLLFRIHQSRLNRIALDIPDHFVQFSRRPNPMIVGLVLPKSLPAAAQDAIGDPARSSFKPTYNGRHRDPRLQYYMHMVRHNRPGIEIIGVADGGAMLQSILNHAGDTRIPQPDRPRTASVESLVAKLTRNATCVLGSEHLRRDWRSGSSEAPSYKNDALIRKPMGKVAAIKHVKCARAGRPQKTMVCPTEKFLTLVGRPRKTMVCPTRKIL